MWAAPEWSPGSASVPELDPLDQPVWGQKRIAEILNMTTKRCEHLLRIGKIDATKKWGRWVSTPRRLLAQFDGKTEQ
jgi:hypothetical protein